MPGHYGMMEAKGKRRWLEKPRVRSQPKKMAMKKAAMKRWARRSSYG
jgi:hypothetical protein